MPLTHPVTHLGHNAGGGGGGNATVFPSRDAYAVFDGVNDNVIIPHSTALKPSTTVSVSYWFRRPTSGKVQFGAYNALAVANSDYALQVWTNGTIYAYIYDGSSVTYYYGGPIPADEWRHITMVYDGGQSGNSNRLKIYVNGALIAGNYFGTIPSTLNQGTVDLSFRLGNNFTGGSIRDVRIYNDALTSDEITYVYSEGTSGTDPTNTNLVGHWKFDDGEGGLIADSSSSGNDGQAHNITEPLFWDKYATFDGVDDYVDLGTPSGYNSDGVLSVSAWIKDDNTSGFKTIIGEYDGITFGQYLFQFNRTADKLTLYWNNAVQATSTTSITDTDWHHVAFVRSGSSGNWSVTFYVDGTAAGTTSSIGTNPGSGHAEANIGKLPTLSLHRFDGSIRDVRIYDDALTSDEITYLYAAGESGTDPGTANLVGKWLLNDGEGSVVADSSSSGNDGTATNITEPLFWGQPHADFDGSNDYVDVGDVDLVEGTTTMSVSAWINRDISTGNKGIIAKWSLAQGGVWQLGINNTGKLYFSIFDGGTQYSVNGSTTLPVGGWAHVTGVYNGTDMRVYVDGVSDATPVARSSVIDDTRSTPIWIGTYYSAASATWSFNGKILDARIYNDALTANEALYLATAGEQGTDPGTANLVGYWKLNDRWGTNVQDIGSGGNDGTATNIVESTFWEQGGGS